MPVNHQDHTCPRDEGLPDSAQHVSRLIGHSSAPTNACTARRGAVFDA